MSPFSHASRLAAATRVLDARSGSRRLLMRAAPTPVRCANVRVFAAPSSRGRAIATGLLQQLLQVLDPALAKQE